MIREDAAALKSEVPKEITVIGELRSVIHIVITGAEEHRYLLKRSRRNWIKRRIEAIYHALQLPLPAATDGSVGALVCLKQAGIYKAVPS